MNTTVHEELDQYETFRFETEQQEYAWALAWEYEEAATQRRRMAKGDPGDPRHLRSAKALDAAARYVRPLGEAERAPAQLVPFLEFATALKAWASWGTWEILESDPPCQPSSWRFRFGEHEDEPGADEFDKLIAHTFLDVLEDWRRYATRVAAEDVGEPPTSVFEYFAHQGYPIQGKEIR